MFWKILFWILFVLFCGYNAAGAYNLEPQGFLIDYTYGQIIFGTILVIWLIFTLGYYWALGWGKRLFPKWLAISMLVIVILSTVISLLNGFVSMITNFMEGAVKYTSLNLWFGIFTLVLVITGITIPFIVPVIMYLIKYKNLEEIKEPIYKIFGIYILMSMLDNFVFFLGHLNLAHKFNFWDYSVIFITTLFEIIIVFSYIFEKRVFTKSIWQTLTCIYVPYVIFAHIYQIRKTPKICICFKNCACHNMGISYYVIIHALINYAFGNKIFKDELQIEEKINE